MEELKKGGLINLRLKQMLPRLSNEDSNETKLSIVVSDPSLPDNPIIYTNQAFCDLTEYSLDEIIGKNCRFLQGENTDKKTVEKIAEAVLEKREITIKIYNYTKSGKGFWNFLFIAPVFEDGLKLKYFVAIQKKTGEVER
jgi:PAS domain S-box-containing protein